MSLTGTSLVERKVVGSSISHNHQFTFCRHVAVVDCVNAITRTTRYGTVVRPLVAVQSVRAVPIAVTVALTFLQGLIERWFTKIIIRYSTYIIQFNVKQCGIIAVVSKFGSFPCASGNAFVGCTWKTGKTCLTVVIGQTLSFTRTQVTGMSRQHEFIFCSRWVAIVHQSIVHTMTSWCL
jgi:hypothetical protein